MEGQKEGLECNGGGMTRAMARVSGRSEGGEGQA